VPLCLSRSTGMRLVTLGLMDGERRAACGVDDARAQAVCQRR
jgi:hypothetical protein